MTHTPPVLSLSSRSLTRFLQLLPSDRIVRMPNQIRIRADAGDAIWYRRGDRWVTGAPGFDTARRFGLGGPVH